MADDIFDFPCPIPLKAIGRYEEDFEDFVVSVVRSHVGDEDIQSIASRSSNAGSYLSTTVVFVAQSRQQMEAIYQELSGHKRVLMLL